MWNITDIVEVSNNIISVTVKESIDDKDTKNSICVRHNTTHSNSELESNIKSAILKLKNEIDKKEVLKSIYESDINLSKAVVIGEV